jgi:indole-3-glycerol phosphate synthase/phosphoribosylanthranilate isomerase
MALVRRLLSAGSVRLLLDTKVEGQSGGTGTMIRADLLDELRREIPDIASQLWIAGGLGPDTVGPLVKTYRPELVDASSRLEAEPGKKDWKKLEAFFAEITASA